MTNQPTPEPSDKGEEEETPVEKSEKRKGRRVPVSKVSQASITLPLFTYLL